MTASQRIAVTDESAVGEARRVAQTLGRSIGFDDEELAQVGIVVTEAASNIVKHAGHGEVLVRVLPASFERDAARKNARCGLEVLALDRGPGLRDAERRGDGYSTVGTLGIGLGAVRRVASSTDVYSRPAGGVALVAVIRPSGSVQARERFETGSVCVAMHGERECGDNWCVETGEGVARVLVIDGLGHGPLAASAAREAIAAFRDHPDEPPGRVMERLHAALAPTRGAAGIAIELDARRRVANACGVGNLTASIVAGESRRHLVSHNGVLGHGSIRAQEFQSPWPEGATLAVATDGISSRWALDAYPGLIVRHPSVVAGVLYRDFARERDDATFVVVREVLA